MGHTEATLARRYGADAKAAAGVSDVDRYHTQPAAALLAAVGADAANVFGLRLEHWVPD